MKDYFAEGADAALAGGSETANPYDVEENFEGFCAWYDGWESIIEEQDE